MPRSKKPWKHGAKTHPPMGSAGCRKRYVYPLLVLNSLPPNILDSLDPLPEIATLTFRRSSSMETCENCGATIGNLETPSLFQNHIVCSQCYAKLAAPASNSTDELKSADLEAIQEEASRAYEQSPAHEI